jgi:hypothetical protein
MTTLEKTVARDSRRNPKLDGARWLHSHRTTLDLHESTQYDCTIGEMLWAAHKHAVLHPEDTTHDPTNMFDRVQYARNEKTRKNAVAVPASEQEWDAIFGRR